MRYKIIRTFRVLLFIFGKTAGADLNMKFNKIIVPVDFSEFSDRAVTYALYLAETFSAQLTLLHAVVLHYEGADEITQFKEYEKLVELQEEHIHQQLQKHHQKATRKGISIDTKVVRGVSGADAILDFIINTENHDLIVMGTHGRTGIKKWLYGSVTEKVVQHSPIPVLTVHSSWDKYTIEKILVPVDFSDYSQKAAASSIDIAGGFNAQLVFLHVITQEVHPAYYATSYDSLFIIDPSLKERSIHNLKKFAGEGVPNSEFVVGEGKASREIVMYAEENNCDLILMATRGLTGLEHLLIGSTTERVVRLAKCPVLTLERD
jgi:nucleotide-binding universal stress UspA family protein